MDINKLLLQIKQANLSEYQFKQTLNGIEYTIILVLHDNEVSFPYIIAIPDNIADNCLMALEVNNLEVDKSNMSQSEYELQLLKSGFQTGINLANALYRFGAPIVIPILPGEENGIPYYQQLSKECLENATDTLNISDQLAKIIEKSKQRIRSIVGVEVQEKIFLNGYSSSGVFAERFCLLHPELIHTACIGGASGSIPVPISSFSYPIGTADYEKLTKQQFDFNEYQKIKFRYYVGELEEFGKTEKRFDENGDFAPMHDMSYMERSVPRNVGKQLRDSYGRHIIQRAETQVELLRNLGIDIEHYVIKGRAHSNINNLYGVNELVEKIVGDVYEESSNLKNKLL